LVLELEISERMWKIEEWFHAIHIPLPTLSLPRAKIIDSMIWEGQYSTKVRQLHEIMACCLDSRKRRPAGSWDIESNSRTTRIGHHIFLFVFSWNSEPYHFYDAPISKLSVTHRDFEWSFLVIQEEKQYS